MKVPKKLLSIFLTICLVAGLLSAEALADFGPMSGGTGILGQVLDENTGLPPKSAAAVLQSETAAIDKTENFPEAVADEPPDSRDGTDNGAEIIDSGNCGAGSGVTWTLDSNGVLTISGNGEIPNYYVGLNSAPWIMRSARIYTVNIELGITAIGSYAFAGCSNLTDIAISDGVSRIGNHAFYGCASLLDIHIPYGVLTIEPWAFQDCSSLKHANIQGSVLSIGMYAFWNCSSLMSIYIPGSVNSIGECAFRGCSSLSGITVGELNKDYKSVDGVLFDNACKTLIVCPGGKAGEYSVPDGVALISPYAFYECGSLTGVTVPDGVTSIGENTFEKCSSLTSIILPDSVDSIGQWAFYECSSLTDITVPDGVTSIGARTFYKCSSLADIILPNSVNSIGDEAFSECSSLTSIILPDSANSIGVWAFMNCSKLAGIILPAGITSVEDGTFFGCSNLVSVIIPDGIASIGDDAFYQCRKLTDVILPDSVTSIGDEAFFGCGSLKGIAIPDGVSSIEDSTFRVCRGLVCIALPKSVASIGNNAFAYCSGLTDVYYGGSEEQWRAIKVGSNNSELTNTTAIHYGAAVSTSIFLSQWTSGTNSSITLNDLKGAAGEAIFYAAAYDAGRMTDIVFGHKGKLVSGQRQISFTGTLGPGWKLYILTSDYEPLCPSMTLSEPQIK